MNSGRMNYFLDQISRPFSFIYDKYHYTVLRELKIQIGSFNSSIVCELRKKSAGETYIAIKLTAAESVTLSPVSKEAARKLVLFINEYYLNDAVVSGDPTQTNHPIG
jgi:hypothetical protein